MGGVTRGRNQPEASWRGSLGVLPGARQGGTELSDAGDTQAGEGGRERWSACPEPGELPDTRASGHPRGMGTSSRRVSVNGGPPGHDHVMMLCIQVGKGEPGRELKLLNTKIVHIHLQFRSGRRLPARVRRPSLLPRGPLSPGDSRLPFPGSPAVPVACSDVRVGPTPRHVALTSHLDLDIVCLNRSRLSQSKSALFSHRCCAF